MNWDRDKERKAGKFMTIGSCIYGVVFLIVWNVLAASMGAWFMLIFGIPMLGFMIFRLVMCVRLAKDKKQKQTDPWDRPADYREPPRYDAPAGNGSNYCPYCGAAVEESFQYCPKCGRKQ